MAHYIIICPGSGNPGRSKWLVVDAPYRFVLSFQLSFVYAVIQLQIRS